MNIVAFDFEKKEEKTLTFEELRRGPDSSMYYWIEVSGEDEGEIRFLVSLFNLDPVTATEFFTRESEGRYDVYNDGLVFTLTEGSIEKSRLNACHVNILLGATFMIMWHRQPVDFIEQARRTYREDFKRFAKTPGFLIYELNDHLIENYRRIYARFSSEVEQAQLRLFGTVDDSIFRHVSALTTNLLSLRKMVQALRELMHEMASRRSPFVSESTQTFLIPMAETLGRMSDDLTAEREALNETLNLYMGMVGHRTNRVVNRLTVISSIFLPLTFICGVYGMNFELMPELKWAPSYFIFWALCLIFISVSIYSMKRKKWI